jgi:hypothetical protein
VFLAATTDDENINTVKNATQKAILGLIIELPPNLLIEDM